MDILESTFSIDKHTELQVKSLSQETQHYGVDALAFVPVTDVRLVSAKINYPVCERRLYKADGNLRWQHQFGTRNSSNT